MINEKKGENLGAPLANNNGAGLCGLITKNFDTEPLARRVSAVLGTSSPLLVRRLNCQRHRRFQRKRHRYLMADMNRSEVTSDERRGGARI